MANYFFKYSVHYFGYLKKRTTWKSSTGWTEHTSTQYFLSFVLFSAAILPVHSHDMQPSKCIYNIVRTLWFSWACWTTKTLFRVLNKSVQIELQYHISYLRKANLLIKHLRVAVLKWLNRCFESARPSSRWRCHWSELMSRHTTFRH